MRQDYISTRVTLLRTVTTRYEDLLLGIHLSNQDYTIDYIRTKRLVYNFVLKLDIVNHYHILRIQSSIFLASSHGNVGMEKVLQT